MADSAKKVLIVGAGSMGLAIGYHLVASGTEVTFLVRSHRVPELMRPQVLYSYDDDTLRTFAQYAVIASPSRIDEQNYDYAVVTLDGAALRDADGMAVAEALGRTSRDHGTKIILGSIGMRLKEWFIDAAGIDAGSIVNSSLGIQCYSPEAARLPLHTGTSRELLYRADLAYRHCWPFGLVVEDSAPAVAEGFAALYSANAESKCVVRPSTEFSVMLPTYFPMMAALELLDWPQAGNIDPTTPEWLLGTEAAREIQGLKINGRFGQEVKRNTTPEGLAEQWRVWEQDMLPLDLQEFNRYHHGGKVNRQDRQLLADCLALGEAEGDPMTALKKLLGRLPV
ncbi:2-dehydropantoate 2-reductase N-terminal domain-containing protein [Rhizobium sp. S152]|uniref:ketopantoate reductase family protein n=1 Tax=Rhizobium sp. S152 TaxID=3055038 RepID=UPI0025A94BCB|nr:2-dehydropantoate 2-reductase N-terminal domain-containing protein [Rhizobium sp. S152]MDM9628991.1 2-dehydropantoate 2-reductase N-terminal domain-containing protein [Rhizobium sp. S152]